MKVLVTGATGFIGRHLIPLLLQSDHIVTTIVRDIDRVKKFPWYGKVELITANIHAVDTCWPVRIGEIDVLIHLAWSDLSNYHSVIHFEKTLPADYTFLKKMVSLGIKQILVTGTCFEYGKQEGALNEDLPTMPNNSYALAKDSLRKFLFAWKKEEPFTLQWARLFYMYGEGQNSSSLLAQLNDAIRSGQDVFNMSKGEQLRDYLPVEQVAYYLLRLAECQNYDGIVNVCSGYPISVRTLVDNYLIQKNTKMTLNLGYYPYADYEPMAFWGDQEKFKNILECND